MEQLGYEEVRRGDRRIDLGVLRVLGLLSAEKKENVSGTGSPHSPGSRAFLISVIWPIV